jgi:hypothetical protein
VVSQPLSQRFGFTAVQQIDRLAGGDVDQGAVHISLSQREVLGTAHGRRLRELWLP